MVYLVEKSNINQQIYPLCFEWDSLVRKHYNKYQQLIDAQTYQIQRIKRYLLVFNLLNIETLISILL